MKTLASTYGRGDMHFLQNSTTAVANVTISDSVMTILNGGNVGIGTTSPQSKLEIKGDGGSSGLTFKTTDASSNENFSLFFDGGRAGVRYTPFSIGIPSSTSLATKRSISSRRRQVY